MIPAKENSSWSVHDLFTTENQTCAKWTGLNKRVTIGACAISFGAFVGILNGVVGGSDAVIDDITTTILFTQFLQGIKSQLVLLAVGVLTVLFILFDKCKSRY